MHWFAILLIAAWMLAGGVFHMITPEPFFRAIPDGLPKLAIVYLSGIAEIVVGIAVLMPRTRALAGLAFAIMCIIYMPIHLWDFFRADPIFSVPWAAGTRVTIQIVLIGLGFWLWQRRGLT